ncbi:MAG: hypothetical protein WC197_04235 [Candidatus Gastranaerophilaceae bacterium]
MNKKRELYYLRSKIMTDIEQVNLLLNFITSYKIETLSEAAILASIALAKGKNINKNNEKIGKILKH